MIKRETNSFSFSVREDHTLALTVKNKNGVKTIVFHDFIKGQDGRYNLFGTKTEIKRLGNIVTVSTPAVRENGGAPIPGLFVVYTFTEISDYGAVYVSINLRSDACLNKYTLRLMDISWEGFEAKEYTGYEYDADNKPFSHTFAFPTEVNPDAPNYEELMGMVINVALEKLKTRPIGFRRGVSIKGDNGYFAVFGGSPVVYQETGFVRVLGDISTYTGDLRFFSGKNSPGAWFLFDEHEDFFALTESLSKKVPELPYHCAAPFVKKKHTVSVGEISFDIIETDSGVWIDPIFASEKTSSQSMPLFYLTLWDTKYQKNFTFDAGTGWDRVRVLSRKQYMRIILSDPDCGTIDGITVVAEAFFDENKSRVSWKMRVINRSNRWSVTEISYPTFLSSGFDTAFAPIGSGKIIDSFNKRSSCVVGKYPTGDQVDMPYFAIYTPLDSTSCGMNGLYMGIHDPDGTPKFLTLAGAPQSNCAMFLAECTATYQRKAGNSYTLPGEMVWQSFDGDWFDATNIYKEFITSQAKWLAPMRGRPDSPDWIREMPVWIMHFMPNENPDANPVPITLREKIEDKTRDDWYRTAVRFRENIGVPVCYHLYNWHWIPFNNDNPNYFPAHHDFKKGMKELKAADIRVIPYMVGYSWDLCDNRENDERFTMDALPNTAKNIDGECLYVTKASTEPDGKFVRFARMCPNTAGWKNEIRRIARKLEKEYGADGIYLDVVSAAYDACFDKNHNHIPGYGSYWWRSYSQLVDALREAVSDDFAVVSESTAEVYSGVLDGYLSWTWVQTDTVPAHSRIYGARTAIFGRVITNNKREDADYFRFQIAQSLTFGQQLGWIHPEIVDDPVQFPFLKKMANLRYRRKEFFAESEMLRPPVVTGDVPLLDTEAFIRSQMWNHEKLVTSGAWEDMSGKCSLFVINASDKCAEVTISVYEDEYLLPEKLNGFTETDGITLLAETSSYGKRHLRCRIEPEGYGVFDWYKGN